MAFALRQIQCSATVAVRRAHLRAATQERAHHLEMAARCRKVEGRPAFTSLLRGVQVNACRRIVASTRPHAQARCRWKSFIRI